MRLTVPLLLVAMSACTRTSPSPVTVTSTATATPIVARTAATSSAAAVTLLTVSDTATRATLVTGTAQAAADPNAESDADAEAQDTPQEPARLADYLDGSREQPDRAMQASAPLLGSITDEDASVGCGCRITTKDGKPIFISAASGDARALIHVRGADLIFSLTESGSGRESGERLGIHVDVTMKDLGSACPAEGENCESDRMSVKIEAKQGGDKMTLTGEGECGC